MQRIKLTRRIALFTCKLAEKHNVEAIEMTMALMESAALVLATVKPSVAESSGNHLFDLLCDEFASALAHYAAGGKLHDKDDEWLRGNNDDETRFRIRTS